MSRYLTPMPVRSMHEADALMLRAAKSLHIVAPDHAKLTPAEAKEVQRHLDAVG